MHRAVVVGLAVLCDVVTTAIFGLACRAGENNPDARAFCDADLYALPLLGIVVAMAGAIAARRTGRDWPWVVGSAAAFALALSLWVLRGDPAGNF